MSLLNSTSTSNAQKAINSCRSTRILLFCQMLPSDRMFLKNAYKTTVHYTYMISKIIHLPPNVYF